MTPFMKYPATPSFASTISSSPELIKVKLAILGWVLGNPVLVSPSIEDTSTPTLEPGPLTPSNSTTWSPLVTPSLSVCFT